MKLLHCPDIGPRPLSEYVFGGELREMPDPHTCSDAEWADYVYHRQGAPALKREWWYHTPTGTWLIAERHTLTDVVSQTWLASDYWRAQTAHTETASPAGVQP